MDIIIDRHGFYIVGPVAVVLEYYKHGWDSYQPQVRKELEALGVGIIKMIFNGILFMLKLINSQEILVNFSPKIKNKKFFLYLKLIRHIGRRVGMPTPMSGYSFLRFFVN